MYHLTVCPKSLLGNSSAENGNSEIEFLFSSSILRIWQIYKNSWCRRQQYWWFWCQEFSVLCPGKFRKIKNHVFDPIWPRFGTPFSMPTAQTPMLKTLNPLLIWKLEDLIELKWYGMASYTLIQYDFSVVISIQNFAVIPLPRTLSEKPQFLWHK